MTFVSFAQNGEDVVLWRALGDVERGSYIDVGAADPVSDSVTSAFYERGWRGINIEPEPNHYAQLIAERPEDINIQAGVAAESGEAVFIVVEAQGGGPTGLSTFDIGIAEAHSDAGFTSKRVVVPLRTLTQVCEEHVNGPIHFLKVDVEGYEEAVFNGADFERWRPWIVLAEATYPNSDQPTHGVWEPLLLRAGYRFILFDGLNRFYVASEHWDRLHGTLSHAASVRDGYVTAREHATRLRVVELETLMAGRQVETDRHVEQLRSALGAQQRAVTERQVETERHVEQLRSALGAQQRAVAEREGVLQCLRREAAGRESAMAERQRAIEALRDKAGALSAKLQDAQERLAVIEQALAAAQQELVALHASTCWRVTAPLRGLKRAIQPRRFFE
jgi:FkbM family methyltransferase